MFRRTRTTWAIALAGLLGLVAMPDARAQTVDITKFPAPAVGEFGPQAEVSDGLPLSAMVAGDGVSQHTPGEGAPDTVGAFRFLCNVGQNNSDDPVVAPGIKGGAPHTHQWFGNKGGNFASTYASLRTTGGTTCASKAIRTAYWMPDMRSGNLIIRPDFFNIYYKRPPQGSPNCTRGNAQFIGDCIGVPNAIKFIFGYDFITGKSPTGAVAFKCVTGDNNRSDYMSDMVAAAAFCQTGDRLFVRINAPDCWDGVNLDSSNHRDHVAYTDLQTGKCPSTHPKLFPQFTLQAAYLVDNNLDRSGTWSVGKATWYLSCDRMTMPNGQVMNLRPGTCMHQDYFEAWNNRVKKAWTDNCIDKLLNCSGGDLGNGYGMPPDEPVTYEANPRYVKVPLIRGGVARGVVHVGH